MLDCCKQRGGGEVRLEKGVDRGRNVMCKKNKKRTADLGVSGVREVGRKIGILIEKNN